jgi:hypothetical protein
MRVRWFVAVCAFALLCGTPFASARVQDLPSGTVTLEATGPGGATYSWDTTGFTCDHTSGDPYPIGDTTVICDDGAGGTPSFVIHVQDTTGPSFSNVPNINTPAISASGAVVSYSPTATDLVSGDVSGSVICSPASPTLFGPSSTTTVNCSASDAPAGNTSSASFTVTVGPWDATAPNIGVSDTTVEATSASGAFVHYSVSFSDPDDAVSSSGCTPASDTVFDLGDTPVNCSATDSHGNSSSASFAVHVVDTTGPVFGSLPNPDPKEATSTSGATVTYANPTATDAVKGNRNASVVCTPVSGSTFSIGTNPVQCTANDGSGNGSSTSFNVTVQDTTKPQISNVPGDIVADATSSSGRTVTFGPTATDLGASVPVHCVPASGSTFAIGATIVVCTATDNAGNRASESFTVTIQDTLPPVFGPAPDVNADVAPGGSTVVTYTKPTATDAVAGVVTVNCTPAPGFAFPIGSTTVNCSASDPGGHSASTSFHVIVTDHTPPVITVPADITAQATGLSGAAVTYAFTAADPDDAVSTSNCSPASGTTFAIGQTTVTCNATDSHTNSASPKTFKVTVVDTTPPVLSSVPADKTVEANGFAGSMVDFVPPTAVDLGEPRLVTCAPDRNTTFALGTTTVTCSASDGRGNTGIAKFKINVVDTTPPTLIPPGNTTVYATSDTGAAAADQGPITRFIFGSHVADIADPNPKVTADNPQFFPVGTTTVVFTATDASGNKKSAPAKLTVLPKPEPGTTPPALPPPTENTPPANPTGLTGKGGDRRATLKWTNPKDSDFAAVEIERGTNAAFSSANATGTVVYHGTGTSYIDKGLTNDVSYRYVVHSLDKNGNKSQGVGINITPHFQPLRTPADGARLAAIPKKFVWTRDPKATYYNLQLFLGGTLLLQSTTAEPRKILSTWTNGPSFNFKSPWKWEGKSYKIAKGTYTWYVWPGYGARADVKYGPQMGPATFQITKTPKPAKPKKKKK